MAAVGGQPPITVGDALADTVETRRGPASPWVEALHELGAVDRAVYEAVAKTPTQTLDGPMRRLSEAANYSRLWLGLAAAMAMLGGQRGRRAALEGVVAIGVTSATVNLGFKQIHRRRRPTRDGAFPGRHIPMPKSTSFPSGHAASAFAFAYAVGRNVPVLALPIRGLALGVAYSRVHIGVHYPGDVAVGSIIGGATGATVAGVFARIQR
jgi:membrane-associated phospholipid phosphatase